MLGLQALSLHDVPTFSRSCGTSVSNWVDQMEFRFRAAGLPQNLWVSGILSHVDTHVWTEMKKYLTDLDPLKTSYSEFVISFKEVYKPQDLSQSALFALHRVKQRSDETIEKLRIRSE